MATNREALNSITPNNPEEFILYEDPDLSKEQVAAILSRITELYAKDSRYPWLKYKIQALRELFPQEYAYTRNDQFLQFAYPEYLIQDKEIDISPYRNLYHSYYSGNLIDALIAKMNFRLERNNPPPSTCIKLVPHMEINSELDSIERLMPQDRLNLSATTFITLSVLTAKQHAYAFMFHLNIALSKATVLISNPYGWRNNNHEVLEALFNKFKIALERFFPNTPFALEFLITKDDLQGIYYNDNNCAPISLYILDKYLTFALCGEEPNRYKVDYSFDCLNRSELNLSLYQAFILRLKATHLNMLLRDNFALGFQGATRMVRVDIVRSRQAIEEARKLFKKMVSATIEAYDGFLKEQDKITVNKLSHLWFFELLNRVSTQIIETKIRNCINPPRFSLLLSRALRLIQQPIEVISGNFKDMQKKFESSRLSMFGCTSVSDSIMELSQLAYETNNSDLFLARLSRYENTFISINHRTQILRALLAKLSNGPVTIIRNDICSPHPVLHNIISHLLKGAHIYAEKIIRADQPSRSQANAVVISGYAAINHLARLPPLSFFAPLFIERFPECVQDLIVLSAECCNFELLEYLLQKEKYIKESILAQARQNVGRELSTQVLDHFPTVGLAMRDPQKMQEIRIAEYLIKKTLMVLDHHTRAPSPPTSMFAARKRKRGTNDDAASTDDNTAVRAPKNRRRSL